MAKQLKSSKPAVAVKKPAKGKLSLYPLSLETALGAALQTGVSPRDKSKNRRLKSVDKPPRKTRKDPP